MPIQTELCSNKTKKHKCIRISRRYTREQIVNLVHKHNITLVSEVFTVTADRYVWECLVCKYKWEARANNIIHRRDGCPRCAKCRRYSIDEIQEIVKKNGLELLHKINPINMSTKYKWKCLACKHIWTTTIDSIKNRGTGCPKCSLRNRPRPLVRNIDDAKKIASDRGLVLLSTVFLGMKKKHEWKCPSGHTWLSTPSNIRIGNSCPTCAKNKQSRFCRFVAENKAREIFEELTRRMFPSDWHTLGNGQQLDGYCKELNIAFEYNGSQHYTQHYYWHKTKEQFEYQQNLDRKKSEKCKSLGIAQIIVPYTVINPLPRLKKFIIAKLTDLNIPIYCRDMKISAT